MRAIPTFEEFVTTITEALCAEGFYVVEMDAGAEDEIKLVRSAGRRAGRNLGWKVRTLKHGPRGDSHLLDLHVIVDEDVPEIQAIRRRRMREAITSSRPDTQRPCETQSRTRLDL